MVRSSLFVLEKRTITCTLTLTEEVAIYLYRVLSFSYRLLSALIALPVFSVFACPDASRSRNVPLIGSMKTVFYTEASHTMPLFGFCKSRPGEIPNHRSHLILDFFQDPRTGEDLSKDNHYASLTCSSESGTIATTSSTIAVLLLPWRCRGPGGSHRLQNGWGAALRGLWWVRLPYASASDASRENLLLTTSIIVSIRPGSAG
jgi:hypothetical protein